MKFRRKIAVDFWSLDKGETVTKINQRHHSSHPPSAVRPNLDINKKPNPAPVVSPRVQFASSPANAIAAAATKSRRPDEEPDDDDGDNPEDRLCTKIHLS
jgi:hypothetical protein